MNVQDGEMMEQVFDKTLPPSGRKAMIALGQVPIRRQTDLAVLMWRGE